MDPISAFFADPVAALGNIIATSYLLPLGIFVGFYGTRSPWWDNELGIALLLQKLSFIAVFALIVLGIFFHDWEGRQWVRLVVYALVGFSLWLDIVNLRRYQRRYPFSVFAVERPKLREIARRYMHLRE